MKTKFVFVVLLVVAGLFGYQLYKKYSCKKTDQMVVASAQLKCLLELDPKSDEFRNKICAKLNRRNNCKLDFDDIDAVEAVLEEVTLECMKDVLEEANYCTDNVKVIK